MVSSHSTSYSASRPSAFSVDAKVGRSETTTTEVTEVIAHAGDDGMFDDMSMVFDNSGTYMEVGFDGDVNFNVTDSWCRFQSVALEQGVTILSASIKLIVNTNASADFDLAVRGEDVDDSSAYTGGVVAGSASLTTASVTWTGDSAWAASDVVTSPDIKTIIQEIVDRGGWATGNDLTIQVKYDGGSASTENYRFKTYDNDASVAAVLTVTY